MTTVFSHAGFSGIIGLARVDITPPVGIFCRNWGAAPHDAAEGIHRPLTLGALTLQAAPGDKPLVFLDADLGWFADGAFAAAFLSRLRGRLELPSENLLFGFTHTHSAPPLCLPEPHWKGGDLLPAYVERVFDAAIAVTQAALSQAVPSLLEWHTGRCALAANRDLPDDHRIVCGYNPENPADDTLLVGRITGSDGRIRATLVHYACHPTTLAWDNRLISPDYLGALRETISAATGGAPTFFFQGASGELAPRYQYVGDPDVADAHGRELGYATLATLSAMEPPGHALVFDRVVESGAPLATWRRAPATPSFALHARRVVVELPLKAWPSAMELEAQYRACPDRAIAERLRRKLRLRQFLGDGATLPLDLFVWRIGDAVLLGTMMEAHSCLAQRLRARFPDRPILWLNLVNGSLGYLAPADRYDGPEIYQVWQTPCERGSLEMLEEAAVEAVGAFIAAPS